MAFVTPLEPYYRANYPSLPESREKYYQEELKKLEKTIAFLVEALKEADARLVAGGL